MSRGSRALAAVAAGLAALLAAPVSHAEETAQPVVRIAGDRLTVDVRDVPVPELLQALARATGAAVRGATDGQARVSARFDDVGLTDGLERLLGRNSFALVYAADGSLRAIKLLGRGPDAVAIKPEAPPAEPLIVPIALTAPFDNHAPIAIDGLLARALGKDHVTFAELTRTTLHHADRAVREAALRASVRAVEEEPALRAHVVGALRGLDDQALARLVRRYGGINTAEALEGVTRQAQGADLRERARSLLPYVAETSPGG
jgi:hypothetical protein